MKLHEISKMLETLKIEHNLDSLDIILINRVNNLHADAFVMRVLKDFKLCSQATAHARIKRLIRHGVLAVELDGDNMRTKRLVLTNKAEEVLYGSGPH